MVSAAVCACTSCIVAQASTPTIVLLNTALEKMNLNHKQTLVLGSLIAFLLCTIFIAQLEIDPMRTFESENEDVREYIVIPKSRKTKLERRGEAEWLNQ